MKNKYLEDNLFAVGKSWKEIKYLLNDRGIVYNISISKPTKDFFQLEYDELYVIRQRWTSTEGKIVDLDSSILELVLASRLKRQI